MDKPNDAPIISPGYRGERSIGAILVKAGRLTATEVERIQRVAVQTGMRFGAAAIQLRFLAPEDVEFALSKQFYYPVLTRELNDSVNDEVVAAYAPDADAVESLRTIRTRLMVGWLDKVQRKLIAITSAQRGEGRSWLAANLATVFAQAGQRTLLIDADMRNARQHQLFKLDNEIGLSTILTGRVGREAAQRINPDLRLFVLPAGPKPPNPQELLTRKVFGVVLEGFARQFDLIVIDTPAIVESADAELLASNAGAALMLTRRHHTRHRELLTAVDCLRRSGVSVIGSVVNDY